MPLSERLNTPISIAELDRALARGADRHGKGKDRCAADAAPYDHMGGYVKYFTDMPATNGYPNAVVFRRNDEMTVVCQGPFGGGEATAQGDQLARRQPYSTTPSYASAHYTKEYDAAAATALKPFAQATIGYVGTYQMLLRVARLYEARVSPGAVCRCDRNGRPHQGHQERGRNGTGEARSPDAGRRDARGLPAAKPGLRDTEVAAVAQHYSQRHGSEYGIYSCASIPFGEPSKFADGMCKIVSSKGGPDCIASRRQRAGRHVHGTCRSCVVGAKVPQAMKDELEFCKASASVTLDLLKPGTSCKDVWNAFDDFMRKDGRPAEARLYCHGQGYDLVERPLVRHDEPMTIERDMNIVVHPTYIHAGYSEMALR